MSRLTLFALALPLLGARENGCGPISSMSPAPSMTGSWAIEYDDRISVLVKIGGAVYDGEIGTAGGTVTISHDGEPITFQLDCARPEIVCPSEVWATTVSAEHKEPRFPHRFHVKIPRQECSGSLTAPSECGAGTSNPDCDDVCDGTLTVSETEHFGVVSEAGDRFDLLLGAKVATNGINCGLLGLSLASADLVTAGSAAGGDWEANEMENGEVVVGYAGGCLWAGDPDGDAQLEALIVGATIELRTGFTGTKR